MIMCVCDHNHYQSYHLDNPAPHHDHPNHYDHDDDKQEPELWPVSERVWLMLTTPHHRPTPLNGSVDDDAENYQNDVLRRKCPNFKFYAAQLSHYLLFA